MNLTKLLIDSIDKDYRLFSQKLIPDTNFEILGVRVPKIRNIAKQYKNTKIALDFLSENHKYYEEWFLHGILIGYVSKDIDVVFKFLDDFLPHLDNWAICDSTVANLKIFKKHPNEVAKKIRTYLKSTEPYTVRFAIVSILDYFLEENFLESLFFDAVMIKSKNYYVNMAIAWLISVGLVKKYSSTIPILENGSLPKFIHNKSIQKAIESFRIDHKAKDYLKTLRK